MRINPDDLRRHYASLPDGALLAIDRHELTDQARAIYDEEATKRRLLSGDDMSGEADEVEFDDVATAPEADLEAGPDPDWLEDAACACSFTVRNPNSNDAATDAFAILRAARIPCHLTVTQEEPPKADAAPWYLLRLMVPLPLTMQAHSILDHDLFNEEQEAEWRGSFEMLSDDDLRALDPDVLCAGILDRAARLKRAYGDEMARRGFTPRRS